jgi:hypothetical protein
MEMEERKGLETMPKSQCGSTHVFKRQIQDREERGERHLETMPWKEWALLGHPLLGSPLPPALGALLSHFTLFYLNKFFRFTLPP